MSKQIHVVAIRNFSGDSTARTSALAAAIGVSIAESRGKAQGPGPRIVAVHADRARAEQVARLLAAQGLDPLVLGSEEIEQDEAGRVSARSFQIQPSALRIQMRDGNGLDLPYSEIRLLLRGTILTRETHTETSSERKVSMSRAVITGGLALTKKVRTEATTVQDKREAFLHVYAPPHPAVALREAELLYQGLGPAMQPTRPGNFAALQRELRARARAAAFDDHLASRAGQAHILGGVLAPQEFLEVAIALLARTLGGR